MSHAIALANRRITTLLCLLNAFAQPVPASHCAAHACPPALRPTGESISTRALPMRVHARAQTAALLARTQHCAVVAETTPGMPTQASCRIARTRRALEVYLRAACRSRAQPLNQCTSMHRRSASALGGQARCRSQRPSTLSLASARPIREAHAQRSIRSILKRCRFPTNRIRLGLCRYLRQRDMLPSELRTLTRPMAGNGIAIR